MFFCCSQDEFRIRRRLFQSLEESIESSLRKHVNLIDDIHFISSHLRWYSNLVNEITDVINGVI